MEPLIVPAVHKIAIFRALALGDFIFALPALEALRSAYPDAEFVYLGRKWHASFLPGRLPGSHRVIAVPPASTKEWIEQGLVIDPPVEQSFLREMQSEAFDLALQMHGGGEFSNPFVLGLRPRFSAGLKSSRAVPLDRWVPYGYYQNETARMLEVVSLVGASTITGVLSPRLRVLDGDLEAASSVLDGLHRPFAVIHPGSTDPRRCWSPDKYAAVADFCAAQGLQVVLTGTIIDGERIQAVERHMQAPAVNLCDQLSLPGLVGLLSQATLFVGNDSGPLHLAMSVGARAVGLFWAEYIINSMPLARASFYPLVAWRRDCPVCQKYCDKQEIDHPSPGCTHETSFIEEIAPADVISGVEVLLSA